LLLTLRKEVCDVLDSFLSFLKNYEERKVHNMDYLMLDPWFKSLRLVSSFVGREQVISIVKEYDQKSLQPMLLKCYHHLHRVKNYDIKSIEHKSMKIVA